jgi:hypothetical protein
MKLMTVIGGRNVDVLFAGMFLAITSFVLNAWAGCILSERWLGAICVQGFVFALLAIGCFIARVVVED